MNFVDYLWWSVPLTLLILAILQVLYIIWLNVTVPRDRQRTVNQPSAPLMPTHPTDRVNTSTPGQRQTRNQQQPAPDAMSMDNFNGKMIILSGLTNVSEITLPGANFAIGRFYNPDFNVLVAFDERSISRRHAVFSVDEMRGYVYLTDTNSSYGTTIRKGNDFVLLTPGQQEQIFDGDVVQFGNVVTVRFVLPGDTRSSATQL